jgi:hypothetical protein
MKYVARYQLFTYALGNRSVTVDAARAFDAREQARVYFETPTYDGLLLRDTPKRLRRVIRIDYVGSAMNNTLERVVTEVKL